MRRIRRIRRIAGWRNKREADMEIGEVGLGVRAEAEDLRVLQVVFLVVWIFYIFYFVPLHLL